MSLVDTIYERREVVTPSGERLPLHSEISREEGDFIEAIIRSDPTIKRTIEVGCAYGLSSLRICEALKDRTNAMHLILDPAQSSAWHSIGIANLHRAGLKCFEFLEEGSEFVLPRLAQTQSGTILSSWMEFTCSTTRRWIAFTQRDFCVSAGFY
jgi:hypothetical protein